MTHAAALFVALLLDAAFGEPRWLWSRWPHPAVLMGRAVAWVDRRFNTGNDRFRAGALSFGALVVTVGILGWIIPVLPGGVVWETLIAAVLLAQRSLADHVGRVASALRLSTGDGRLAVAQIVGRDTANLDDSGISRAAIESAAENLSDGVVAPVFWFLIAGLPGLLIYKMTNTADSMIGYRSPEYEQFGKAAARFDDVLNWVPARLTALLILLVHGHFTDLKTILRDAPLHRSPNAGWPEAAMALVLNVALSGPRVYDGESRDFPWVNGSGNRTPGPRDIDRAIGILWRVWGALVLIVAFVALV